MVDQAGADAYNSWWQFRNDSWSRLEEATARINSSLTAWQGRSTRSMTDAVHDAHARHWHRWNSSGRFPATPPSVSSRS